MRKVVQGVTDFVYRVTTSNEFFPVVLGLFVLQAVWLACTAIYPLPFDEYTHVGAIQLYAEQFSPLMTKQPIDTGIIGDLTRESSLLYRWLMSFPYRVLINFLSFEQVVIALRLISVAMVTGGIVLFRKLLEYWGISQRIINVVALAFVMTPIVPFLAAHVNYDNMMFLLTPIVLIYATKLLQSNHHLVKNSALFVLAGAAATLTKQTFLPLMGIMTIYVVFVVGKRNYGRNLSVLRESWQNIPKTISASLVIAALVFLGAISLERFGGNLIMYGTLLPKCETIHPFEFCEDNGPWYRNNVVNIQNRPSEPPYGNPVSFSQYWVTRMMRGYFVPFAHTPTQVVSDREPYGPIVVKALLPVQVSFAAGVAVVGTVVLVIQRRTIWRNPYLRFAMLLTVGYIFTLWLFNYRTYLSMWRPEAIQARYTYPIILTLFTLIAWALSRVISNRQAKAGLVVAFFAFYVWGGGIAGWLIRADDTWRWQHPAVQSINRSVQTILRYTTFH